MTQSNDFVELGTFQVAAAAAAENGLLRQEACLPVAEEPFLQHALRVCPVQSSMYVT
jgi:hypothetical protein